MTFERLTTTRRKLLKGAGLSATAMPFLSVRASAQGENPSMPARHGHAEPNIIGEFEEANNVKFTPKYYSNLCPV